jgi:hypothetical protein
VGVGVNDHFRSRLKRVSSREGRARGSPTVEVESNSARLVAAQALLAAGARNKAEIVGSARRGDISARNLELRFLLHLPSLITPDYSADDPTVQEMLDRLVQEATDARATLPLSVESPAHPATSPKELEFARVDSETAAIVHRACHYIASPRNGDSFGLFTARDARLSTLVTVSEFDLGHVAPQLPATVESAAVLVVSRVLSFDWAPRDCISYLLARVVDWLRKSRPGIKLLLTYVNPNIGFAGTSYRAANWQLFGWEWGTRCAYVNGRYRTDRQLIGEFGTAETLALRQLLGDRFAVNAVPLSPLMLFAYGLDAAVRIELAAERDFRNPYG